MGIVDLSVTMNATLIIYLVTYLLVNGFLVYLLIRLSTILRDISTHSKNISVRELNEFDELKQALFDIQNTAARQLSEINKLKQTLSSPPTVLGAGTGFGKAGVMARNG